jgi:preprotein translocase subunit SecD
MRTDTDLRGAYAYLAANAPRAEALQLTTDDRPARNGGGHRGWIPAVAAALAVVVAVAIALLVRGNGQGRRPDAPPVSGQHVICAPGAGAKPSAGQLDSASRAIADRMRRLGVPDAVVRVNGAGELDITAPGTTPAQAGTLCTDHRLDLRPLITAAVPISGATSGDPLSTLPFAPPTTEGGYRRLSPSQRDRLTTALAHTDCAALKSPTAAAGRVVCDGSPARALLLGPTIAGGTQVASAAALPPDQSGSAEWTVAITFRTAGQTAWSSYTTAHNTGGQSGAVASATACGPTRIPCADFVAFVLDGSVLSVPVNLDAVTGSTTQITGGLTQAAATTLAGQIADGQLAVALRTVSVQPIAVTTSPSGRPS